MGREMEIKESKELRAEAAGLVQHHVNRVQLEPPDP